MSEKIYLRFLGRDISGNSISGELLQYEEKRFRVQPKLMCLVIAMFIGFCVGVMCALLDVCS